MKTETKVGLLFLATLVGVILFAFFLGIISPFSNHYSLNVMYNFAGGIEVGSPVRVMGVKVGKVKSVTFTPEFKMPSGEEVKLQVTIDVDKKAWPTVRADSKYFINMAGVIGEKFLEITPGSISQSELAPQAYVRGEDPPRIDQLISQSYGLAGKVIELVEKNEGSFVSVINQIDSLLNNFNKTLTHLERATKNQDMQRLIDNSVKISDDVAYFTSKLRSKKAEDTYELVHKLLFRLEGLDAKAIRTFLQEEGIKAKLF